eukprot:CAMPEP_0182915162 /NCGR_PEP_ID=MMETSP0105_2-20130417/146_1 /TAXON_ID=81532 ORGANISM="Acanthoeca-like sp., Strain 10tr" /NCGR_SAMPLE_ID=MMETSP0105_2 /ASSEMBLY_ACC=CAM_ASM_000205 /LENGTH=91 /DNA_ID=CAMNT_0025051991 /DNA_START=1 /DNA_END=272 /DNA_ORIENTATION=-
MCSCCNSITSAGGAMTAALADMAARDALRMSRLCAICGCTSEVDECGDRICWCDSCRVDGCAPHEGRRCYHDDMCSCCNSITSAGGAMTAA